MKLGASNNGDADRRLRTARQSSWLNVRHLSLITVTLAAMVGQGQSAWAKLQGPAEPSSRLIAAQRPSDVVYFATNRNITKSSRAGFGDDLGELTFGTWCPLELKAGNFDRELPAAEKNHGRPANVPPPSGIDTPLSRRQTLRTLKSDRWLQEIGSNDVVLFIHGYNYDFPKSILRARQLQAGLKLDVPMVVFCWPSKNQLYQYFADQQAADQSVEALRQLLELLTKGKRKSKVHIMAHSMGNRILLKSVANGAQAGAQDGKLELGRVLLAAPDVSRGFFESTAPALNDCCQTLVHYYSTKDLAARQSARFNRWDSMGVEPARDSLAQSYNVDPFNRSLIGHDYYFRSFEVLKMASEYLLDGNFKSFPDPTSRAFSPPTGPAIQPEATNPVAGPGDSPGPLKQPFHDKLERIRQRLKAFSNRHGG